ncbi:MAG TPA: amidohydrolase family protein [Gemmatimonadales bacterium]|nr:amidohydrolase family protein [Gemmatimonadales bacterium]
MTRTSAGAVATLALATLAGAGVLAACNAWTPDGVALVGATVFDGTGAPPRRDAVVVVRDGHIEAVTTRAGFSLPRRTTEVDVRGKWIIPGLIDAHAHVAPWALTRYLAWGVTTVRDVHGTLDTILALRQRANTDQVPSPRIYSAGAMIDGRPPTYADAIPVDDASDARRAVDRLAVAGVDLIKVYTRVDPPVLKAIIDEANTFHLPVAGHLGLTDAVTAARLGLRSDEHMSGVPEASLADPSALLSAHYRGFWPGWTAFEQSWAGLDSAALDRVARELAARHVVVVPTLVLHETFSRLEDTLVTARPELRAVPAAEQTRWDVPGMIARAGWGRSDLAAFRRSRPMQDLFLRRFRAAGGTVATGTDASNQLLIPGFSVHQELELLVHAGFTPAEALLAATRNGAALIGADSLGTIVAGKAADLVVLRADPLDDIRNTRKVERVMLRGRLMPADSIRKAW